MTMTRTEFREAVNKMIKDAFADHYAANYHNVSIIYDGEYTQPPDGRRSWLRVKINHNAAGPHTLAHIGERRFEQIGVVFVQVFAPHGTNAMAVSDELVDVLTRVFREHNGGIRFTGAHAAEIGKSDSWQQTNFTVNFAYDEKG